MEWLTKVIGVVSDYISISSPARFCLRQGIWSGRAEKKEGGVHPIGGERSAMLHRNLRGGRIKTRDQPINSVTAYTRHTGQMILHTNQSPPQLNSRLPGTDVEGPIKVIGVMSDCILVSSVLHESCGSASGLEEQGTDAVIVQTAKKSLKLLPPEVAF